jgi:hypothetical protein
MSERKIVRLTISLETLCEIWDSRDNPNDTLDDAIEKLIIKGLQTEGRVINKNDKDG